ncbi:MAG: hypothetical protein Q9207_004918 [Kuettlingeria erythrocarpa]
MVMVVHADPTDQAHKSSDPPVEIVLAYHDMHLLASLLHYMFQQGARPTDQRMRTDLTFHIHNQFKASGQNIYERLIAPTRLIIGTYKRATNASEDIGEYFTRAFQQSFNKHYWTPDKRLFLLQQRSLAILCGHNGLWEDAARAVIIAFDFVDLEVDKSSSKGNTDSPSFVWFLKSRLEVLLYAFSLKLRIGLGESDNLDRLPTCCQALDNAQPTTRLVSLGEAIKSYLQFTRPFYEEGTISPALLQATLHHDPQDELQLGTRAMLKAVESGNPYTPESNEMINQVDESLQFAGLDRLVARLYRICFRVETGYTPNLTPIGSFPTNTLCSGFPGISVPAFASSTFAPSPGWAGALTLINNGLVGSRFEFSFIENDGMNKPGNTFYDVDMELGISAATMAPTDHRVLYDGFSQSLAGEANPLAKANEAWLRSPNRWELLHYPKYIVADKGSRLV